MVEKKVGKPKNNEVELYFKLAAVELAKNPICAECGAYIPKEYYRAATAHIFPKNEEFGFPSVAANPYNRLFLGSGCGCHQKTHRLDTFVKLKVWTEAVRLFRLFEPYIKESNKYLHAFKELADEQHERQ